MTLIKFNIENKTKEQRKKEVLNKLRKIQSLVESDANYTEMVYHIITNASLQKKNMKVNLDHYGNYTVIDAKNKIVSGGMVNSNESKPITTPVSKIVNTNPKNLSNNSQSNGNSVIQKTNMSRQQNKPKVREVGSSGNITSIASQSNTSSNTTTETSATETSAANTTVANTTAATPTTDLSKTSTPVKKILNTENQQVESGNNVSVQDETEKPSFLNTLFGSSKDKTGTSDAETSGKPETSDETGQTMTPEKEATGQPETSEKKETGPFGLPKFWGGKKQTKKVDDNSFPSFHTTVFNDGSDDVFMEHMKNMSSKKYLRSLTTQELKDIMRSNHMKVTHNGSYYNKEQMVNKVYQFYK